MSRRAPTRRNGEYAVERLARQVQSMIPGTAGGRLASASLVTTTSESEASSAGPVEAVGGGVLFARDRFPSSGTLGSTPATVDLTYWPVEASLHLYLNGLALDEGGDYTLSGQTVTLLGSPATTGDVLEARYAYATDVPEYVTVPLLDDETSPYSEEVLADNPLVYLRMGDDGTGAVLADSSGNSRDGVIVNAGATFGEPGLLDGDTDTCVELTPVARGQLDYGSWMNVTDLTLECLFKTTESGTYRNFIVRDSGFSNRHWNLRLKPDGHMQTELITGAIPNVNSSAALNDGNPHHIAVTYDGANLKMYVDGVLDDTEATSVTIPTSVQDIQLGTMTGHLDEVAIYGTALSAARITAHFAATGL